MSSYGSDLQSQIYGAQTAPAFPIAIEEWEARAQEILAEPVFDYVAGGAGAEDTMRANREAFYRWQLRPRMRRAVVERDLAVHVLGTACAGPLLLAPVGVLGIVHPEA